MWLVLAICPATTAQVHQHSQVDRSMVRVLATIAAEKINRGDLLGGAAALRDANAAHRGTVLRHARLPFRIGQTDLNWGQTQVERLLQDRPQLTEIVEEDDELWRFLCEGFGGAFATSRVEWDPASPDRANAQHYTPRRNSRGRIQVARHKPNSEGSEPIELSAEEVLAATCFELHNMARSETYRVLFSMALRGQIAKDVFVREAFLCEVHAVEETRAFYANVVLPYLHAKGFESNPKHWWVEGWWHSDGEARNFPLDDKIEYPWVPFATHYDLLREQGRSGKEKQGTKQ